MKRKLSLLEIVVLIPIIGVSVTAILTNKTNITVIIISVLVPILYIGIITSKKPTKKQIASTLKLREK